LIRYLGAGASQAKLKSGLKPKAIHINNVPEFIKLGKELEKDRIRIETTVLHTPSQNDVAKRVNQTLITKTRALLESAQLPTQVWGEAVHTACYLKNLTPNKERLGHPQEPWTG